MKYQPMLSVAGGPFEPVGLPLNSKAVAETIAEGRARRLRCRTDWYVEEINEDSDSSSTVQPADSLADGQPLDL